MKIKKSQITVGVWVATHELPDGTELIKTGSSSEEAKKEMLALIEWNKPEKLSIAEQMDDNSDDREVEFISNHE